MAMKERGEHLQIFDINQKKAPTLAQITLQLAEYHDESHDNANAVDWIADGIKAQNDQWVLATINHAVLD